MNKQKQGGIEWCDFSWNPIAGCKHSCQWQMPDGSIASCYAGDVANGLASSAYPHGFEYHYWHPNRLEEPLKISRPSKIFVCSMADLFGRWVNDFEIREILDIVATAKQHQFQILTKNAPRLLKFKDELPANAWIGTSVPPSFMFGKKLTADQKHQMFANQLHVLSRLKGNITWFSLEPLSWDIVPALANEYLETGYKPDWLVIGAASNGKTKYQSDPTNVEKLMYLADELNIPVFHKNNLDVSSFAFERHMNFPITEKELRIAESISQMG